MTRAYRPRWIRCSALALALGGLGCVSNTIVLEDEGSDAEGEAPTSSPSTATSGVTLSTSSPPPPTTTPPPDPDTTHGDTSESDTAGGPGFCSQTCESAADCGQGIDFECNDGFCEFVGEIPLCDPATCDDLGIGVCGEVDGFSQCTFPCTPGGGECDLLGLQCTGTDDAGSPICESEPCLGAGEGEPCAIEGFGSFGTCTDGLCVCSSDRECSADGLACRT